jgi:CheY-like chemotaxis protein
MRSVSSNRARDSAVILLVDDNRDGMLARRSVFEELGYGVVSACCGAEALQTVQDQKFDLIITDYRMSPINGLELIRELRLRSPQTPIILLSGFAENLGLDPANTGADVVVQKSANEIANLVRCTRRLLQPPKKPVRSLSSAARARVAGS